MQPNTTPPESELPLNAIWHDCVHMIAGGMAYPAYVDALKAMHGHLPADARAEIAWPVLLAMGRMVWKQTPHPDLGYALAPLPVPQRNAPCHCGSGRKYKQCCLLVERDVPAEVNVNFLPLLMDCMPRRRWRELAGSRVPLELVWHAAAKWNEDGRAEDVCRLLEPWFADDADFRARREALFDSLLDAYTEVPHPHKKTRLLERAIAVGDRRLRSVAMQRKASMLGDRGDTAAAWQAFTQAQRADPNSPSLSHVEVTLLLGEGRHAEARERARFWARRLGAMRDPELAGLVAFLHDIAEHGEQVLQELLLNDEPELRALHDAIQAAPPVASHYQLDAGAEDAGALKPERALLKALQVWYGVGPARAHSLVFDDTASDGGLASWLPVLHAHPVLWNAFEVLDVLVEAVHDYRAGQLTDAVERPLLERAEQLLREVLRANGAEGKRLEWGWLENRPALSLLGDRIAIDGFVRDDDAQLARLQWLVRTLNPNDNQGFRDWLMRAYLERRRFDDALALGHDYPDDSAAMHYNTALALHVAGQPGPALAALRLAVERYPKPRAWLLKANPKAPAQGKWGIAVGGGEEAWLYRQDTLALWQELDAMDWLRHSAQVFAAKR